MRMIKWTTDIISGNLREARKYIGKAYELRESCRPAADWCKEMAVRHLEFNQIGHSMAKKMIEDYANSGAQSELMPGMKAVYNDMHADIMRESAEVQAMIAAHK